MLTLRYNPSSCRYDCYDKCHKIETLTCSSRFNLYCEDEDVIVAGRIEHNNTYGYYFIGDDEITLLYLYDGLQGGVCDVYSLCRKLTINSYCVKYWGKSIIMKDGYN